MKTRNLNRRAGIWMLGLAWMVSLGAQDANVPSAESILDRFVEVTGGQAAYENLSSTVARGTMEIAAAGITGQLEIYTKRGLQYTKVELPGVGVIESGVRDGVAWESSVITGPRILTGAEAELTILGADPAASAHWRDIYTRVEATGVEEVRGESAYRVSQTMESGFSLTAFYSVDSGLLLKQQMTLQTAVGEIPMQQFFEEYGEFGGIRSARRIMIDQGVAQVFLTFTDAQTNVDIPDERFALPEAVQALLK